MAKRQRVDTDAAVPHGLLASAQLAHAPPTPTLLGSNALSAAAVPPGQEAPVVPLAVTPLYAPPMWLFPPTFPPAFPPASMQPHGAPLLPAAAMFVPPSIRAV